ncbi:MAG: hypothetical protein GXY34_07325 [Syntrophomonadaceae bacterium]|nr:hypothetical protein [Syntrophomonadaceae bacterium]
MSGNKKADAAQRLIISSAAPAVKETSPQGADHHSVLQRAMIHPQSLNPSDIMQLQRSIGNRGCSRLLGCGPAKQLQPAAASPKPRVANHAGCLQMAGNGPYKRELRLQTNYVRMAVRHDHDNVKSGEVDDYEVISVGIVNRPPTYLKGNLMENQGQHKVAWRAIWGALELFVGLKIPDAWGVMQRLITDYGKPMRNDHPAVYIAGERTSPVTIDNLLKSAHNYLCTRQWDDPSWPSNDPDQLKGKGETALKSPLAIWADAADDMQDAEVLSMFQTGTSLERKMSKLLDTTGRSIEEKQDARQRAKEELKLHNPDAYPLYKKEINDWLQTK